MGERGGREVGEWEVREREGGGGRRMGERERPITIIIMLSTRLCQLSGPNLQSGKGSLLIGPLTSMYIAYKEERAYLSPT